MDEHRIIRSIHDDSKSSSHIALRDHDKRILVGLNLDADVMDPTLIDEGRGPILIVLRDESSAVKLGGALSQTLRMTHKIVFKPKVFKKLKFSRCGNALR